MSPLELLFGRKPRITLGTQVPHIDGTDLSRYLDIFILDKQVLKEVTEALEKRHRDKVASKQSINAQIARSLAGVLVNRGDSVLQ